MTTPAAILNLLNPNNQSERELSAGLAYKATPVNKNSSRIKLSSWPRERKLNLKLSIFRLRTFEPIATAHL